VTEPEFVLLDEPVPAPGASRLRPLRRAGRHGVRKSVLIRIEGYPRRRRFLVLALVAVGVGAAAVVVIRRLRSRDQSGDRAVYPELDTDTLAIREPAISAG
jgi:hypothetical protein